MATRVPLVSIVMPVYNDQNVIRRSIESILGQTFSDFELILVDDGSTDKTNEIIRQYSLQDDRVVSFTLSENQGIAAALNYGIAQAHADLIARMDADDYAFPNRLSVQTKFMEKHLDVGVVGCNFIRYYEDCDEEKRIILPQTNIEIEQAMSFANPICHPSVIIRKQCFSEHGVYNPNFRRMQDYELWMRWRGKVKFYNIQNILMRLYSPKYNWEIKKYTSVSIILGYNIRIRLRSLLWSRYRWCDLYGLIRLLGGYTRRFIHP